MTVKIVEVGPRDGLQYEDAAKNMSPETKLQFIKMLVAAGLRHIEAGSFVRRDKVPQMANSAELAKLIAAETWPDDVEFSWLTPNMRGFEDAMKAGAGEVAVFIAANDGFSGNNIDSTIEESLKVIAPVMKEAAARGIKVRGYVSTIFAFKGEPTPPEKVVELTKHLLASGCYEVSLGDTTGVGTPETTEILMKALVAAGVDMSKIAAHFHDTGGRAIDNCKVAYKYGIRTFDSSAGGLGGCPFSGDPKGNQATEGLVEWLESISEKTGVSSSLLAEASLFGLQQVGKQYRSRHLAG